jgi:hypothetical protein
MSETANKSSTMAVAGCAAMIGIAWALATICVFINIRNGVRLTTDNYGSFLNGALEPFRLDVNRNSNRGFPRACKSDSGPSEGFGGELDGTRILE